MPYPIHAYVHASAYPCVCLGIYTDTQSSSVSDAKTDKKKSNEQLGLTYVFSSACMYACIY